MTPDAGFSEVWVCFEPPPADPPPHVLLLSFMVPSAEAVMQERLEGRLLSGRILVQDVRSGARSEYVQLIARLGSTRSGGGQTLREAMQGPGNYSRWWLLHITEKDCLWDEDTVFLTLLRLMVVQRVKEEYGILRIRLYGAAPEFGAAMGQHASLLLGATWRFASEIVAGLLSRVALLVEYLRLLWMLRRLPAPSPEHRDVLLQGYWDWTVRADRGGQLRDSYFVNLPAHLAQRDIRTGWLASCEPHSQSWQRNRRTSDVVASSTAHPQVTLLERYLTPLDIARTVLDIRHPIRVTLFVIDSRFRKLSTAAGFDLSRLVRTQLLQSVWHGTFCRLQLVATATARACLEIRPAVVLTAFELFLRSRALCAGVRAGSPDVRVWAAQHAGYSSDKTLGVFDPAVEIGGEPDGCAVPAPDGIFVLGDLSRRIWQSNGFDSERLVCTGGLRYEGVKIEPMRQRVRREEMSVLVVGGMHEEAHVDLCDAVITASSGIPSVRILWRDHPSYLFSDRAGFRRFRKFITVTGGTLAEDLEAADLVIFSQTGLAEEALLRGIPTWQWLWPGFNTSPFLDLPVIPSFTSVAALRSELRSFIEDSARYLPTLDTQQRVLRECFGPDPARASTRIADAIQEMIGLHEVRATR